MRKRNRAKCESEDEKEDYEDVAVHSRGNKVYFYADVSKKSVYQLITKLEEATQHAILAPSTIGVPPAVYLYIHSDGGDAYAGLSAFDHIRAMNIRVITIADGFVASAATFILLAGRERWGMPSAHVLIHQIRTGFWGKYDDLLDEVKNSRMIMRTLKTIYRQRTNLKDSQIASLLTKELNLPIQLCLRYGVVTKICDAPE